MGFPFNKYNIKSVLNSTVFFNIPSRACSIAVVPNFQEEEPKSVRLDDEPTIEEIKTSIDRRMSGDITIIEDKGKTEIVTSELVNGKQFTVTIRIVGRIKPNSPPMCKVDTEETTIVPL